MSGGVHTERLGNIADLNPALPELPTDNELVSFLPMAAVDSECVDAVDTDLKRLSEVSKGYTPFINNDVLVAKITPCFENGKIALAKPRQRFGFGSTEFHVVRPNTDRLEARYLVHFLRQRWVRLEGERKMTGSAGQRRVPEHFLRNLPILLPCLAEQRRIAEILDKADTLRAKRRAALAHLDSLTQSIFLDLFGDPITNPKGWPRRPINEIGKVITGNTPPRTNPSYYGTEIEWIKSDNLNTPHYFITKAAEGLSEAGKTVARTAPAGSILVTCIAGTPECIGNAAMTDREVAFNQQINALISLQGNAHFFYAQVVVGKRLIQEASTNGMKGMVSKGRFEKIKLIFPPVDLQHEFARLVEAVEKLKTTQRASLAETDALFASLQHRAFNGQL